MSELSNLKTDIALIKADVKNIERFFRKVESSIDMMTDISQRVAVQDETLKFLDDAVADHRREDLERSRVMMERLEDYRKSAYTDHQRLAEHSAAKRVEHNSELLDKIGSIERTMHSRVNDQSKKIAALENWKYYMMGVSAVALFILIRINWPGLFG